MFSQELKFRGLLAISKQIVCLFYPKPYTYTYIHLCKQQRAVQNDCLKVEEKKKKIRKKMKLTNRRWTDRFYFLTESSHIKQGSKNRDKKQKILMISDVVVSFQVTFIRVGQILGLQRQLRFWPPHKNKIIKVFRRCISKRLRHVPKKPLESKIHAEESRIKSGFHWMPVRSRTAAFCVCSALS